MLIIKLKIAKLTEWKLKTLSTIRKLSRYAENKARVYEISWFRVWTLLQLLSVGNAEIKVRKLQTLSPTGPITCPKSDMDKILTVKVKNKVTSVSNFIIQNIE